MSMIPLESGGLDHMRSGKVGMSGWLWLPGRRCFNPAMNDTIGEACEELLSRLHGCGGGDQAAVVIANKSIAAAKHPFGPQCLESVFETLQPACSSSQGVGVSRQPQPLLLVCELGVSLFEAAAGDTIGHLGGIVDGVVSIFHPMCAA